MKNLKKFAALCLALATLLVFAGCGGGNDGESVKKIQDSGVLKVGVKADVPGFGYLNPSTNQYEGFEIDLANKIAEKMGVKVQFEAVTAKTRGPLLDNGELDLVIATFTITEERKLSYNFSDSYFTDFIGLLVKKDSGITGLKDLDGKKIGVAQSATTQEKLTADAKELGVNPEFLSFASYPEIKAALDSGRVDCFSVDVAILNGYLDESSVILDEQHAPQEYGVTSKLDKKDLAEYVNNIIKELKDSGELDKMLQAWGLK